MKLRTISNFDCWYLQQGISVVFSLIIMCIICFNDWIMEPI